MQMKSGKLLIGEKQKMKAYKNKNEICIADGYLYRESIKEIQGRRYDGETKNWFVPLNQENIALLQTLGAELDINLKKMQLLEFEKEETPLCHMPIKVKPYKHQVRAFNFAMRILGGYE